MLARCVVQHGAIEFEPGVSFKFAGLLSRADAEIGIDSTAEQHRAQRQRLNKTIRGEEQVASGGGFEPGDFLSFNNLRGLIGGAGCRRTAFQVYFARIHPEEANIKPREAKPCGRFKYDHPLRRRKRQEPAPSLHAR